MGFGSIGMPELLIILLVVLLLFGAKKLPELARGLGKGIREFKDATKHVENEFRELERGEDENEKK
jgi:sec-independent protein translocase protein TatA